MTDPKFDHATRWQGYSADKYSEARKHRDAGNIERAVAVAGIAHAMAEIARDSYAIATGAVFAD